MQTENKCTDCGYIFGDNDWYAVVKGGAGFKVLQRRCLKHFFDIEGLIIENNKGQERKCDNVYDSIVLSLYSKSSKLIADHASIDIIPTYMVVEIVRKYLKEDK